MSILYTFLLGFSLDIFYAIWVINVGKGKLLLSGVSSVLIAIPGILGLFEILANKWLTVPYCIGLFFGSIAGIIISKRLESRTSLN